MNCCRILHKLLQEIEYYYKLMILDYRKLYFIKLYIINIPNVYFIIQREKLQIFLTHI